MSIDGVLLTDIQRVLTFSSSTALFLLVTGTDTSASVEVLRTVSSGASAYGIKQLSAAKECLAAVPSELHAGVPETLALFHASFYDVKQLCDWLNPSSDGARATVRDGAGGHPRWREKLVLVLEDLSTMWQLAECHHIEASLLQLLVKLRQTKHAVFLTSAVSESALPDVLLENARFAVYPVPPLTKPSCRLMLRARMPPREKGQPRRQEEKVAGIITQLITPSTTRKAAVMALEMASEIVKNIGENRDNLTISPAGRQVIRSCLKFVEGGGAADTAVVHGRSVTSGSSCLYGINELLQRMSMLLEVFLTQSNDNNHNSSNSNKRSGHGKLLAAVSSTTGILLHGPSGCGKSALTVQLSHQYPHVPFFFVQCSGLFSKYLGESEQKLRDVYHKARAAAPSVVVLDDVDVIALSRGAMSTEGESGNGSGSGGVNVSKRMLAVLLCELDGVTNNTGVLTIGTSSAPAVIDAALLRQGRLETLLFVPPLTRAAAEAMSSAFAYKFNAATEEDVSDFVARLGEVAEGLTPASLEYILRKVVETCVLPTLKPQVGGVIGPAAYEELKLPSPTAVEAVLHECLCSNICQKVQYYNPFQEF